MVLSWLGKLNKLPGHKYPAISCHRDFEYAQEGINIGASGYILKTAFQDEEFEEYLKQFSDEIQSGVNEQNSNEPGVLTYSIDEKWPEPIQKAVN